MTALKFPAIGCTAFNNVLYTVRVKKILLRSQVKYQNVFRHIPKILASSRNHLSFGVIAYPFKWY